MLFVHYAYRYQTTKGNQSNLALVKETVSFSLPWAKTEVFSDFRELLQMRQTYQSAPFSFFIILFIIGDTICMG